MPHQDDLGEPLQPPAKTSTAVAVDLDRGIIRRWRKRNARRRVARVLRPRHRRALAERLRCTANGPANGGRARRGHDAPIRHLAASVRTELLEIADLLERADNPDPASVEEIGQLLASGASPLQDPEAHISELYAALYYVRAGLSTQPSSRRPTEIRQLTAWHGQSHHPTRDAWPEHPGVRADPPQPGTTHRFGPGQWRRERRAERKRMRLVRPRNRRILARQLRLTALHATDRDAIRRRHDVLLHYRAAAVRTDLLEIAALLEHTPDPRPNCVAALRTLLTNGCDSPLYNADVHFSELEATLDNVRSGL